MKSINILILTLILCVNVQAEPRYKAPEPPTAEQLNLVCRYQAQLSRGLLWTISMIGKATQSVPPLEYMAQGLMEFYDTDKNEDIIAMSQAAEVLNWIYKYKPADHTKVEQRYYNECMGEKTPDNYWGQPEIEA